MAGNAAAAVSKAGEPSVSGAAPSFLEVMDTIRHNKINGEKMCCPCHGETN